MSEIVSGVAAMPEKTAAAARERCARATRRVTRGRGGRAGRPAVRRPGALLGAILLGSLLGSCDNTFEPFAPGTRSYSTWGYLDASVDTQWIRVRAARSGLLATTALSGLTVSLQELGSGRTIELRDSALPFVNMLSSDPVYAHDFWTTVRIEPGGTYHFRASGWDTVVAETDVRIPRDYQVQAWTNARDTYVWTGGVKYVPFLISYASYHTDCEPTGIKRFASPQGAVGDSVTRLNDARATGIPQQRPACGSVRVTRRLVQVVGSETAWPFGLDWSTPRLGAPSTVSNSWGFLGGVLTKWIPIERCKPAYSVPGEPYCKLRYDSTTATLSGQVTSACGVSADSINIELRELEAILPEAPRIRTANYTDQAGSYEIAALRPGIPHELIVFVGDTTGRYHPNMYTVYRDTLRFTAGQRLTYVATLQQIWPPCP